ncbi:histidinol-phosphatase [Viridothelium virens]|uniref:Histidinol-phosphatase n=1 Tax=Viridothelium virens TaxID=1048519 RepID=A0A6A6HDS9_VIRVR|nr:histidinol-phosphatase [Viridothelium virens]
MPFSYHSHSGQFCPDHAKDTLEDVIQTAISKNMQVLALTEHMPRGEQDRYPGENSTLESLTELHDRFVGEAERLREKYHGQIEILVGFEGEWIRNESFQLMQDRLKKHRMDMFVGSVHHVHTIPIDYDKATYVEARNKSGGADEGVFRDYFDAQLDMLKAMKPPIVGHFDLIRLFSDDANRHWKDSGGAIWEKIIRNLRYIAEYGGLLELNSSALRKGMTEPYPKVEICRAFIEMHGRFVLSDDSHGVQQVALNYPRMLSAIREAGIREICFLKRTGKTGLDPRFPGVQVIDAPVTSLEGHKVFEP